MKVPLTVIRPHSPRDGDFLDALEQWGELPDKLPIPDAVRYLAHLTKQNPAAIQKVVVGAMLAGELRFWGQSGRPGHEWVEGMFRAIHRHARKPRIRLGADGAAKELSAVLEPHGTPHLDAMAVNPREVAALLIARGRKVPDELRHLVTDEAAPQEPERDGADQRVGDWLRAELWTLCEAAYLLSGATPRDEGAFVAVDRDAGGAVGKAYRALKDATLAGSLPFIEVDGMLLRRRIKPADAVAWATGRGMPVPEAMQSLVTPDRRADALDGAGTQTDSSPEPLSRQRWQEGRIVEALRTLGHDPHALVRAARGRRDDPKAQCRAYLRKVDGEHSWTSGIFDKAWERCRKDGSVSDAP
jgi:hypothetical protein